MEGIATTIETIEAPLTYLVPTGEPLFAYNYEPPPGMPLRSGRYEPQRVTMRNGRDASPASCRSTARGSCCSARPARSPTSTIADEVERVYYPRGRAPAQAGDRRREGGDLRPYRAQHRAREAERPRGARRRFPRPQRLHRDLGAAARARSAAAGGGRGPAPAALRRNQCLAPDRGPVESTPLALCDARSRRPRRSRPLGAALSRPHRRDLCRDL